MAVLMTQVTQQVLADPLPQCHVHQSLPSPELNVLTLLACLTRTECATSVCIQRENCI